MTITIQPNERVTYALRYASDQLLVVEKPTGVVTQPGVGHQHDTLLNGLFASYGDRLRQLGVARDFGLLHRLDRETSGLVAVALTTAMYDRLREAFMRRRVRKHYWAVCVKSPTQPSGVIKRPILEETQRLDKYTSKKFARLAPTGKPAVTAYRVIGVSDTAALIEARPITGRLHQVRVHLASIGAGVLGDEQYGPRRTTDAWGRLALHAWRLVLPIDDEGATIDVRSPLPRDLRKLLRMHDIAPPSAKPSKDAARSVGDIGGDGGHGLGGDPVGEEDAGLADDPAAG